MSLWKQFRCVLNLQFRKSLGSLVVFSVIQVIVSLGIAIGYSYLFAEPGTDTLLYLATGAPTIVLVMTGLVTLPMQNAGAKMEGYIGFIKTLPVNRGTFLFADSLIWFLTTLPGLIISTIIANLLFHPGYAFSWTVVPAILLTAMTSIGVGYGFSYVMKPQFAMALSQVLAFMSLMFAPINYPIERLPEWLQVVHRILPIYSMAELIRGAFACTTFSISINHYIILIVWCIIGYGSAMYFLEKK